MALAALASVVQLFALLKTELKISLPQ